MFRAHKDRSQTGWRGMAFAKQLTRLGGLRGERAKITLVAQTRFKAGTSLERKFGIHCDMLCVTPDMILRTHAS